MYLYIQIGEEKGGNKMTRNVLLLKPTSSTHPRFSKKLPIKIYLRSSRDEQASAMAMNPASVTRIHL